MPATPTDAPWSTRGRPRWTRRRAAVLALVLALAAVLAVGTTAAWRLQSNLDTSPLDLGDGAGAVEDGPLDILVMGTDTREGEGNDQYGDDEDSSGAGLTDVMMLVHVAEDRGAVTVVSFPRDLVADVPRCTDPATDRRHPAERDAMLNSAVENGGPGCTVATINRMTGLQIDHFMLADFNAVKELSSAVGGVEVCVNEAVDDPKSGLVLPAGTSSVEGEQALAFLRSRAAFGDGGDESRIRSQQSFLASLARKITAEGTLGDLPALYGIAEVASRNLHVDEDLGSVPTMVGLAGAVRGVDLSGIAFVTAPTEPYEADPNRLQLQEEASEALFAALREDRSLTWPTGEADDGAALDTGGATGGPRSTDTAAEDAAPESSEAQDPAAATDPDTGTEPAGGTVDPAGVPLVVVDASGSEGRDREVAALLRDAGYTLTEAGPESPELPGTQVFFGVGWYDAAAQVAGRLGVPSAQVVPSAEDHGVVVSVGGDFRDGERLDVAAVLPEELHGQTAEQFTCQQAYAEW
nr:LCP family protein [Kocuria dechangensis]